MIVDDRLALQHRDEIIQEYHNEFQKTLIKINFQGEIPTILDVKQAITDAASMDLMYTIFIVPARIFDWREVDVDEYLDSEGVADEVYGKMYHHKPEYREYLLKNFQRLKATGVMD